MLVATLGGLTMFARIGVMRALNRHIERVINPDQCGEQVQHERINVRSKFCDQERPL